MQYRNFARSSKSRRGALFALAMMLAIGTADSAASQDPDPDQGIKDETARIKAETELEKAKAERSQAEAARITALGLPSFSGKTDLQANAGAMEIALLAGETLASAADLATKNVSKPRVLLSGDEVFDFDAAQSMSIQLDYIGSLYDAAGIHKDGAKAMIGAAAIAGITAVDGLMRSETTVSGVDASAISQQMLVTAIAVKLGSKAILPGAILKGTPGTQGRKLYEDLNNLVARRQKAVVALAALPAADAQTASEKALAKALGTANAAYDAFAAKALTPDDKGSVPLARAARTADLLADGAEVMRVYLNKAGGSTVNTKNLATTFGVDPVKISGGVVMSYLVTDPKTGHVSGGGVISCNTALTSLRSVQDRSWIKKRKVVGAPLCQSIVPAAGT